MGSKRKTSSARSPSPERSSKKHKSDKKKERKEKKAEEEERHEGKKLSLPERTKKNKKSSDGESSASRGTSAPSVGQVKEPKTEATTKRLDKSAQLDLADSGVVAFVTLPKSISNGRAAAFHNAYNFIAGLHLSGLTELVASGQSYYAAVFDTTVNRDKGINKIGNRDMNVEGKKCRLYCTPFGTKIHSTIVVWNMPFPPGCNAKIVIETVQAHLNKIDPTFTTQIEVAQQMRLNLGTGVWYALFAEPPPTKFVKQMRFKSGVVLLTHEPRTCRLCNQPGHNVFSCNGNVEKTLAPADNTKWRAVGTIKACSVTEDEQMGGDEDL